MRPASFQTRHALIFAAFVALCALPLRADEKAEPPVPVRTVAPEVPAEFARSNSTGLVTVNFMVDDKGNVQEPKVVKSSHVELEAPALVAIKKWRFKPATKGGTAVAVHVTIPIKFQVE